MWQTHAISNKIEVELSHAQDTEGVNGTLIVLAYLHRSNIKTDDPYPTHVSKLMGHVKEML